MNTRVTSNLSIYPDALSFPVLDTDHRIVRSEIGEVRATAPVEEPVTPDLPTVPHPDVDPEETPQIEPDPEDTPIPLPTPAPQPGTDPVPDRIPTFCPWRRS